MTDQTDPPAGDGKTADTGHDVPTMADVRQVVDEVVQAALEPFKKLLGGGAPDKAPADAAPAGPGAGLDAMIDAAVTKVLGDKDAKDKGDAHEAEHAKLRAADAERAPVDRPRRSRWLGSIYDK
jgi:hypothetical protein